MSLIAGICGIVFAIIEVYHINEILTYTTYRPLVLLLQLVLSAVLLQERIKKLLNLVAVL